MEAFLDQLHARARQHPVFQRLAVVSRLLLALAFLPTSVVKILGHRFTSLGTDTPVGAFFEAMFQTGGYWRFLGWCQLLAGCCLLVPRLATVGAVMFFPIVLNIFVITVAVHFTGTPFITGPMLLASFFLLCWDYDRLKPILGWGRSPARDSWSVPMRPLERAGYALGTLGGLLVLSTFRGFGGRPVAVAGLGTAALGSVLVLAGWWRAATTPRTVAG